ncbi:hypothetical protein BKA64DRAFT_771061 [Cadophora sp. MPI-SDFR-AT-0126]|nr:hypothetical protein BKA64DRAFT_771061 [Leotiomycetes sp. MPI-SDFR-AT-0126]
MKCVIPQDRAVLVGTMAACTGDRSDALQQLLSGPIQIDALVGDYLAEINLSWRAAELEKDEAAGFDQGFIESLRKAESGLRKRLGAGTFPRIAVNAGALNPKQLAMNVRAYLSEAFGNEGQNLVVAYVTGDNVIETLRKPEVLAEIRHLSDGTTLTSWGHEPVVANAYIGQWGIVEALRAGAAIVISGRTTDASTIQAVASWWYGWDEYNYEKLALGLIAGHLIECGHYVTGGNFCGFRHIEDYFDLAMPIAEIHQDFVVVTKQPGQNGVVDVDTVRSQILYEIQGHFYYNPDVIADFSNITVFEDGRDRVKVTGVRGQPPPLTLKVSIQGYAGYQAEFCAVAIGSEIEAKARSLEKQIRHVFNVEARLKGGPAALQSFSFQCLGGSGTENAPSENAATAIIRILARAKDAASLSPKNFSGLIIENLCQAYPGFTPHLEYQRTGTPRPYLSYFPALIPRKYLEPMGVHFLSSSPSRIIDNPASTLSVPNLPRQRNYEPTQSGNLARFGPTVMVPLGHQIFGRSGDKGANVNVGFFPQGDSSEEWDWLRSFLTTERLLSLLGDDASAVQRSERVEFPNMRAIHFVLFGLLGEGVTNTNRIDALGKGIAEYLRSKIVPYPEAFYRGFEKRI